MAVLRSTILLSICIFSIVYLVPISNGAGEKPTPISHFNRSSFPADFVFGAGSAAYQYEGGPLKHGRGPSIWEPFLKRTPDKIDDKSNGSIGNDFYYKYKGDIKMMKDVGLDSFRFSISWSRILPTGKIDNVNPVGVKFYNDVIDEIISHGMTPFVTLLHFDTPQDLDEEYGSFLSASIVNDYVAYANFCFSTYGDRVKHWSTVNEPNLFIQAGYDQGVAAPGRCSNYSGSCYAGNSATEPYIVAHHIILSHAAIYKLYQKHYKTTQRGEIGLTLATTYFLPYNDSTANKLAVNRAFDFFIGWFYHPLVYGDYPESMKELVGSRLPNFTKKESKSVKGSYDFLTFNYYYSWYVQDALTNTGVNQSYTTDGNYTQTKVRNGVSLGSPTDASGFYDYPKGIYDVAVYIKEHYKDPVLYVTENGMPDNSTMSLNETLVDGLRIKYLSGHLAHLLKAIKEKGVRVKGYYTWSFLDDWEWSSGYTVRYGLAYVEFYSPNVTRYLKSAGLWFKSFLNK